MLAPPVARYAAHAKSSTVLAPLHQTLPRWNALLFELVCARLKDEPARKAIVHTEGRAIIFREGVGNFLGHEFVFAIFT